jgi:hypothetical protein
MDRGELIVTAAYLLYDPYHPPTPKKKGLREVVEYCSKNEMQLIIGCNANAHYNSGKIVCCNISGTISAAVHALATCLAAPDVCLRMHAAA